MRIEDMTIRELTKALAATEKMLGPDAYEVRVLRRELDRRIETLPRPKEADHE